MARKKTKRFMLHVATDVELEKVIERLTAYLQKSQNRYERVTRTIVTRRALLCFADKLGLLPESLSSEVIDNTPELKKAS